MWSLLYMCLIDIWHQLYQKRWVDVYRLDIVEKLFCSILQQGMFLLKYKQPNIVKADRITICVCVCVCVHVSHKPPPPPLLKDGWLMWFPAWQRMAEWTSPGCHEQSKGKWAETKNQKRKKKKEKMWTCGTWNEVAVCWWKWQRKGRPAKEKEER